jgi:hypothetical protein
MARKKQEVVAEAAPAYEATSSPSIAEVFWIAFKALPEEAQGAFLRKMLDDPEWYEEIEDSISILRGREEPSRPFEEFEEELKREGRL